MEKEVCKAEPLVELFHSLADVESWGRFGEVEVKGERVAKPRKRLVLGLTFEVVLPTVLLRVVL